MRQAESSNLRMGRKRPGKGKDPGLVKNPLQKQALVLLERVSDSPKVTRLVP